MVIPLPSDPQKRRRLSPQPPAHGGPPLEGGTGTESSDARRPARGVPLPSAIGQHVAPATPSHLAALPTVEEVSAGGVIVDTASARLPVAIIARLNRGGRLEWCLPKGHPEGLESKEQAAVREIAEETGISGHILAPLGSIDYWFSVTSHRVHKTVHHYLLEATAGELTIENDPDHEAVDVAWIPISELSRKLSFPNERRIADLAREVLPEHLLK